ncbi:hypothetical protein NEOLI_000536 [Neolecta irregularis DAH-3]|uniref:Uncharacterized protein n=1 Tax=Neolecta irregularis (strain DAH-3) TaxID=1198029 RepID=A0A1U7LT38_NEOID|nr:hypothetical protein NEOLI_000536 [Neolecta irregularis DAH-3]|eukprot:OLL25814.1 hypothetical protein NEOLI_000536 [Neolecta irregularis DAH-3]
MGNLCGGEAYDSNAGHQLGGPNNNIPYGQQEQRPQSHQQYKHSGGSGKALGGLNGSRISAGEAAAKAVEERMRKRESKDNEGKLSKQLAEQRKKGLNELLKEDGSHIPESHIYD